MAEIHSSSASTLPGEDEPRFHHHHQQQPITAVFESEAVVPSLVCAAGSSGIQLTAGSSTVGFPHHGSSSDAFCLNKIISVPNETIGLWCGVADDEDARAVAKGTLFPELGRSGSDELAIGGAPSNRHFEVLGKGVGKRRKDSEGSEFECEAEDADEAMEELARRSTSRTSSKRSRAAEVHNLSEKRRRSRINEKMKALQNLIPNANKTDKASMLDEAIEYLKQLQLQVQMLSMRNGPTLSSVYTTQELQSLQMPSMAFNFGAAGSSLPTSIGMEMLPMSQQNTTSTAFCLVPSQCHPIPYQFSRRTEEIYGVDAVPQQQLDLFQSANTDGQTMLEGADSLEARLPSGDRTVQTQDVNNQVPFEDHPA